MDVDTPEGRRLAAQYQVTGLPTFVLEVPDGPIVRTWTGFGGGPRFVSNVTSLLGEARR